MTDTSAAARPAWGRILPAALLAFVVSRFVLVAIVLVVEALPLPYERYSYAHGLLLTGLTGEDAVYYLGIAAQGYHLAPVHAGRADWVFFPAFPLVARLLSLLTLGNIAWAGVLAANAALLVALLLVGRLVADEAGQEAARWTTWLVAFAPGAVAFGWAYSDSLLLAASAGALLAARHRRSWLMAGCFAIAVLARMPGILLAIPLLAEVLRQDDRRPTVRLLALTAGPLALLAFAFYQGMVLGDPLAFIHGQVSWDIPPITQAGATYGTTDGSAPTYVIAMVTLLLATLLAYTATLPGIWRSKLPRAEVLVALVAFASVFLSGRLQSDARYLAVGWPFAWFLGTRGSRWRGAWLGISVAAFVVYGFLNVSHLLAP